MESLKVEIADFDAAEYLTSPEARYWFLYEALEPPIHVAMLTDAITVVARAAGGTDRLAYESGVTQTEIEQAIAATSVEHADAGIRALLAGLRRYVPASRLVA